MRLVELINKKTGKKKSLEFFHAQRLLCIDSGFDTADKTKYTFDGKEIVPTPKKKKKESKGTDK